MAKTHKPETAAPPRKRRAEPSAPIAAQGSPVAAFPRSVSGLVPRNVSARRESSPSARAASRPSPVLSRAAPVGAIVSRRAADHLRSGHLWVYASDVVSVTLPKPEDTLLPVADQRGNLSGHGALQSSIANRAAAGLARSARSCRVAQTARSASARSHRAPQAHARRCQRRLPPLL